MISRDPPPGAVAALLLGPTIAEAYRVLFANAGTLAKLAALPFILVLVAEWLMTQFDSVTGRFVWEFGVEVPWALFAVPWLRCLLLPPSQSKPSLLSALHPRYLRCLGYALLLSFLALPLTFYPEVSGLPPEEPVYTLAYWALYAVVVYLGLRLSFVYPAVAADEAYSLALSWRHTGGISFTFFLAICLGALLPWYAFNYLLSLLPQENELIALAIALAWYAGFWLLEAIYLVFIAIAFRRCTGWIPAPDPSVLERFE